MSSLGSGPRIAVTNHSGVAEARATRSECWRPTVRGATPIATNDTTSITRMVVRTAGHHAPSYTWSIVKATSTVAEISQSRRRKSAVLR